MEDNYEKALSEVYDVLNHSEDKIKKSIPKKFWNSIIENMDKNYIPNIDYNDENWDKKISEDAQAILALIYRDYLVSDEERRKLLNEEKEEEQKQEQELRKKYSYDKLFQKKQRNTTKEETYKPITNVQLTEIKKESWIKKILNKIAGIFRIE